MTVISEVISSARGTDGRGSLPAKTNLQRLEEVFALSNAQTPVQDNMDHEESGKYYIIERN